MKRIRILGLAILAVFALSAVAAVAAQAEGPYYKVNGTRLVGNEEVTAKAQTAYKLEATGIVIECKAQKLVKGAVIVGSTKGNSSTSKETIEFEECKLTGNGTNCKLAAADKGIIKTEPVINTLDYPKKVPAKGDTLLVLFTPESGSVFVKIKVEAGAEKGCTVEGSLAVEGSVAAEALDNNKIAIKLKEEPAEAEFGFVNFPVAGTEACSEKGGKVEATDCKKPKLTVSTKTSKLTGTSELKLASKLKWGVFGV
jgi:hypothetical protein